jgi:hypothetical protein
VSIAQLEAQFYRAINGVVEPAVRAGWGSPGCSPNTMIVLETTGRRSGRTYRTPLAATRLGDRIFVSTLRSGRSHWLKNLAATPEAGYWLAGRRHDAQASVLVNCFGVGVVVLTPSS